MYRSGVKPGSLRGFVLVCGGASVQRTRVELTRPRGFGVSPQLVVFTHISQRTSRAAAGLSTPHEIGRSTAEDSEDSEPAKDACGGLAAAVGVIERLPTAFEILAGGRQFRVSRGLAAGIIVGVLEGQSVEFDHRPGMFRGVFLTPRLATADQVGPGNRDDDQ